MLIAGSPGFACVGAAGSMEEALTLPLGVRPEVVLLDIHMPGTARLDRRHRPARALAGSVVLMHTVYEEDELVFESLCNGASGYILKRTPPARLLEAIFETRAAVRRCRPRSRARSWGVFRQLEPAAAKAPTGRSASPQETRLLALIAAGSSYREAADGARRLDQHRPHPHPLDLREAPGPHPVRGCRQGDALGPHLRRSAAGLSRGPSGFEGLDRRNAPLGTK
jgi:DNA-binding NarL/FixJ family response regulator